MAHIKLTCFHCGKVTEFPESVGFREECEHCGEDAHVCKNCEFYDRNAYNECREPSAEVVREKNRNNYCEYFQASGKAQNAGTSKQDLMSAAEALFKKK